MKTAIQAYAQSVGANLCGIANVESFRDAPSGFHPADIYPACRSVIVIGNAMPKGTALISPRLVYTRSTDIIQFRTDEQANLIASFIEAQGFTAVPLPSDSPYAVWDPETLTGQGILSMKHAAVLAGLGTMGKNTLVLNAQYGNMLTFGAILTDLALSPDNAAETLCIRGCTLCIDQCPANAIKKDGTVCQTKCRPNTYATNSRGYSVVQCNTCRSCCPMRFGKRGINPAPPPISLPAHP